RLLFVTSAAALARNIGRAEAGAVIDSLAAVGGDVVLRSDLREGIDSDGALAIVQAEIAKDPKIEGVVLIGGHDAVPARRLDTVPTSLRPRIADAGDADHFVVW